MKIWRLMFHRVTIVTLSMVIQLFLLVAMLWRFSTYFVYFYVVCLALSAFVVLSIINNRSNPAYKIAWIVPILLLPIFGGMIYMVFGRNKQGPKETRRMAAMRDRILAEQPAAHVLREIAQLDRTAGNQSRYIADYAYNQPYRHTATRYLPQGEIAFEAMKREMEAARHYIFLEFFIVQEGVMWDSILEILVRKVREGVEVRMIYDDMGCMFTLPHQYHRKLEALGIHCLVFGPFRPELSSRFNNRSHRKILVVDGHTAFTGGINLADEYINARPKYGHWKDTAILLKGEAAWSMTVMFLSMWGYVSGREEDYAPYRPPAEELAADAAGYAQPYADTPLDGEAVGENIYMNLIAKAQRYVHITTPYLIVDNEMLTCLCTAAKSSVEVCIITPHVPDKWYVHAVTRHSYQQLVESGVRIFEYTPGFIHAKSFAVDDVYGVVGTVNLDYRSLYLHFECGVWLYRTDSVAEIEEDFRTTLERCQEVTLDDCLAVSFPRRVGRMLLSAFSPLM